MQNIPIKLATPGMVLAKEIKNPDESSSMPVCGQGVKLTASLLDRLQTMGIQAVIVEGHPVKLEGEATLEQMLEALDLRFSRVQEDPLMMKIKTIYRRQILRSMGESGER
jgi:hypothetical protein